MSGIRDLLLAAQARKSPFLALAEGAVQGLGEGYQQAPRRALLNQEYEIRARALETDKMIRERLGAQQEERNKSALRQASAPRGAVTPGQKLTYETGPDGLYREKIVDVPEPASLDAILARRVQNGEMTLEAAMGLKSRGQGGESPSLAYQKEKDAKMAVIDEKELQIPGYTLGGDVRPTTKEAQDLRDGVGQLEGFLSGIDRLKELVKKRGSTELFGADAGEMGSLAASLKLSLKEVQRLGVLSASDTAFLEAQIGDPTELKSLFTSGGTALRQLDTTQQRARSELAARLKAKGYVPAGGADPAPGTGAGGGGIALTGAKATRLAELRAKAAQGKIQ